MKEDVEKQEKKEDGEVFEKMTRRHHPKKLLENPKAERGAWTLCRSFHLSFLLTVFKWTKSV